MFVREVEVLPTSVQVSVLSRGESHSLVLVPVDFEFEVDFRKSKFFIFNALDSHFFLW